MKRWRTLPDERLELYSPIGLKPIDETTGRTPIGWVHCYLDLSDSAGAWRNTSITAALSLGGIITYPGLERRASVIGQPPRRYRIRIEAQLYAPLYRSTQDAIEFDAYPYNDANPPQNFLQIKATQPQDLILTPLPHYPFPGHVPVLRGVVRDTTGIAVANALVAHGGNERVLTDSRGTFALPLRWAKSNPEPQIDAADHRTGRTGTITIQFPQDLRTSQTITVA